MARIIGGAMPQPYGAFDPGSGGPRMDLLFRGILERMQGIQTQKQAGQEKRRKAELEERGMVEEESRGELAREKFDYEKEPLILPPEVVKKVAEHFKISPEAFNGLKKDVQTTMIGAWKGEAGREEDRKFRQGLESARVAETKRLEAKGDEEKAKLKLIAGQYGTVRAARERLESIRTDITNKYTPKGKSSYTTADFTRREEAIAKLKPFFDLLGGMDYKLQQQVPLAEEQLEQLKRILEQADAMVEGRMLGGGLAIEKKPEFEEGVKPGEVRLVTTPGDKWEGQMVQYNANTGEWELFDPSKGKLGLGSTLFGVQNPLIKK